MTETRLCMEENHDHDKKMISRESVICSDARYSYESSSLEELAEMIEQQEKVITALMMVVVIKMEMRTMTLMALVMTVVTTIDDNGSCDGFGGFVCDDGW